MRWLFPSTDGPCTPLARPRTVLGRGDDCGTALPGAEISRHHAEILRDLNSRNGSFLNGIALREGPLGAGDVVRLGEWIGVVVDVAHDHATPFAFGTIAPGLFGGPKLFLAVNCAALPEGIA